MTNRPKISARPGGLEPPTHGLEGRDGAREIARESGVVSVPCPLATPARLLHALAGSPAMPDCARLDARALGLGPAIPLRFRYLPHNRTRHVRYLVDVAMSTTHTL